MAGISSSKGTAVSPSPLLLSSEDFPPGFHFQAWNVNTGIPSTGEGPGHTRQV